MKGRKKMHEKDIVLDVLGSAKASLAHYATFISETAALPTLMVIAFQHTLTAILVKFWVKKNP